MKIAIMQPYIFPYIGYFQLMNLADSFVFLDDVNFKKKGFINRNNILVNGSSYQFTIPCKKISQNHLITDTLLNFDAKAKSKLLKTIRLAYAKAPYYFQVLPLIESVLDLEEKETSIADLAVKSCVIISKYLHIATDFKIASTSFSHNKSLDKADRLISITKELKGTGYINLIGGASIYDKSYFKINGVDLSFIKTKPIFYDQYLGNFIPNLSIIDVLMFNSVQETKDFLSEYKLI